MRNVNLNILKFLESIDNFYLSLANMGLEVSYQLSVISSLRKLPTPSFQSGGLFLFILPSPQLPLCNNYWQPEIRWVHIILCAFCQKNFFFAIKLHKKKIIVVGEIDSFTRLN